MKSPFFTFFLLALALCLPRVAVAQTLSPTEAESLMWKYLAEYSPDSYEMMKRLEGRPSIFQLGSTQISVPADTPPISWVSEYTPDGVITSLNTIVHETIHGFTSSWPYVLLQKQDKIKYKFRDDYSAYFFSQHEVYLVKHTKVFSSNEIARYIPKRLKTFRFDPYISPKDDDLGSQAQGIYGLMDEWTAYLHGTKAAFDLFDHYEELAKNDPQVYLEHISDLAGTYFAHYEFKYYVLSYLLHARRKYPEIYGDLLSNHELRKAYKAVDENFSELIEDFQLRMDSLIDELDLESNPQKAIQRNGYFFIGRKGVGLFVEERDDLINELNEGDFIEMDKIFKPFN